MIIFLIIIPVARPAHQQHVVPDDEQLFDPLPEPLPPPQVAAEARLGDGPQAGLGGAPLDVVSSVLHRLFIAFIIVLLPI